MPRSPALQNNFPKKPSPVTPGHSLIIPKSHCAGYFEITNTGLKDVHGLGPHPLKTTAGKGVMLICLEHELTTELIKEMAGRKPQRVSCLDEALPETVN